MARRRVRHSVFLLLGSSVFAAVLAFACYGLYLATTLTLPKGEEHPPLLIYGAPFPLKPDQSIAEMHLLERLSRLGYREVSDAPVHPGSYRVSESAIDLYLHGQEDLHVPAERVLLQLDGERVTGLSSPTQDGRLVSAALEPQLISGLRGVSRQVRTWLPLREIPPMLVDTILGVEDHRFYWHPGIDPIAIGRAIVANVSRRGVVQGGSTITQQLAKNLFYSPKRTLTRKFQEAVASLVLETKYSKDEILESYLNEIYLGQAGSVGIYGVAAAAQTYFGKEVHDLSIEEVALIAGLIKGPNTYSPLRDKDLAKRRRDIVLGRLRDTGGLTTEEWKAAFDRPVQVFPLQHSVADAPYFVDYLLSQVESGGLQLPAGAKVYTTLDPVLQRLAADFLEQGLTKLETSYPNLKRDDEPLQGALVVMDPRAGEILAMVGGRDYRVSQFNRAVQAKRQPGSLFKPFVYLAAFEGQSGEDAGPITAATTLLDEPVAFESGTGSWSPQNYDRQFRGKVTVREALEHSLNVPVVRVAQMLGAKRVADVARQLGIRSPLDTNLTLALGASSVSLLEMVSGYAVLAHEGIATFPTALRQVVSEEGDPLWHAIGERHQVVSPQAAYLVTSLLKGVVDRGTATKARAFGLTAVLAGKTGTTDGYRDAWFIGYTPEYVIGIWIGFDDGHELKLSAAQAALPIWTRFARQVIPAASPDFAVPSGVISAEIDPHTGQLATDRCPEKVFEVFIQGTEPTVYCEVHGGGLWERFKRTFGL